MTLDYLTLLADDIEAFATAVAGGPPDAPIGGCPGWTMLDLGEHLGAVHRWAHAAIVTSAMPQLDPASDPAPREPAALADWVRAGGARLLGALHALDPEQPTWHPFPVEPKVAGLWRRRQAQEASVHRWDAQRAAGLSPTIDVEFAADGIDEYWGVMLPRLVTREQLEVPSSVFGVATTDTEQQWVIDGTGGSVRKAADGSEPAGWLRGSANEVLLSLWGRPVPEGAITVDGDPSVCDAWLSMGGA